MKPDQHKQKRSAQYQKKHGKKNTKESEQQKTDKKGGAGKSGPSSEQGQAGSYAGTPRHENLQENVHDGAKSDQAETQKSFRRREVKSNWSRYEELERDTDVKDTQKGADFSQLLQVTSDALSQFRFKSEQQWEDDLEVSEEALNTYLSVDILGLAKHMHQIPLHTRLNIEPSLLPDDMIQMFEEEARLNKTSPTEASEQGDTAAAQVDNTTPGNAEDLVEQTDELDDILDMRNTQDNVNTIGNKSHEPSQSSTMKTESKNVNRLGDSKTTENDEDDLDFLLSMTDSNKTKCESGTTTEEPNQNSVISESKDGPVSGISQAEVEPSPLVSDFKPSKTENLEDWLDSVLDD